MNNEKFEIFQNRLKTEYPDVYEKIFLQYPQTSFIDWGVVIDVIGVVDFVKADNPRFPFVAYEWILDNIDYVRFKLL